MTVLDYPDFQTPQAHATAISTTGAPLLTLAGTLLTSTVFTLTGGQSQSTSALTVTQLGYEVRFKLSIGSTATIPFVDVTLIWTDAAGANIVAQETWMLPCGSGANYIVTGTGPTKGSMLTVTVSNQDPAITATVTVIVLTNSRIYRRDRWIAGTTVAVPTFIIPGGDPRRSILCVIDGVSVGVGVTISRLLPPYHGDVLIYCEQSGVGAANSTAKFQVAPTGVLGTGDLWSGSPTGGAGTGLSVVHRFPRCCTLFSFTNSGTVSASITLKVIMLDDKS